MNEVQRKEARWAQKQQLYCAIYIIFRKVHHTVQKINILFLSNIQRIMYVQYVRNC